jgi:hypothetical protein
MALNLFISNLRPALRDELMKNNPPTLYEAFQQAIQLERLAADPKRTTVHAMPVEVTPAGSEIPATAPAADSADLDGEIDALNFKLRALQRKRNGGRRPDQRNNNNNSGSRPRPQSGRSTATRESVCWYCNKNGHFQDVCRSRLRDGAPEAKRSGNSRPNTGTGQHRPNNGNNGPIHQVDQNQIQQQHFVYAYPAPPPSQDFQSAEY